jgi:uncharacterized membrane protein (UPF0136 family)
MKTNSNITYVYAVLVFIGGVIGYIKAESVPSLIMGTSFAVLLALCAKLIRDNKTYAYVGALVLMGLLLAFFGHRFIVTEKFMPPGLMAILSLIAMSALLSSRPVAMKK